jgi:dehydrogenase/reductase SDR family protein 7B
MSYFKGKTIWITGASSGIGEALVKALSAENANIILSARNVSQLENVQREAGLTEDNSLVLPLDLADMKEIDTITSKAIARFGRIDILFNNGGISQRSLAIDTKLEVDRTLMEVNYFGTLAITKSVLPHMIKAQSGLIVVTSSIAGKFGFYLRSAYSASKHALQGYFETLRMELHDQHIRILLVCPGKIATHISENALTANGSSNNRMDVAQVRGMTAEDCASHILKGIRSGKDELMIGSGKEHFAILMKRIFPRLFSIMIRKQKAE